MVIVNLQNESSHQNNPDSSRGYFLRFLPWLRCMVVCSTLEIYHADKIFATFTENISSQARFVPRLILRVVPAQIFSTAANKFARQTSNAG